MKTSSELQHNVLIRRVINSHISTPLVFIYRDFKKGKQHNKRIHDPTLQGQRRTFTRPCIVNLESYSNKFKFFDLPQAKSYQILEEKCYGII